MFVLWNQKHYIIDTDDSPRKFQIKLPNAPPCHHTQDANRTTTNLQPNDITFTLVLQLSDDRLWMMRHHCHRWGEGNPISVVVYTPRSREDVLDELVGRMGCSLLGHFTADHGVGSGDSGGGGELVRVHWHNRHHRRHGDGEVRGYPINRLRNMALSAVPITHALLVDVDLWPSAGLHRHLSSSVVREALAKDPRLAIVVPAFQLNKGWEEVVDSGRHSGDSSNTSNTVAKAMPSTTRELIRLWKEGGGRRRNKKKKGLGVTVFDWTNRGGHGTTRYDRWLEVNRGQSLIPRQDGGYDGDGIGFEVGGDST